MFRPVLEGLWSHRDIVKGVFTFDDLLDAHELLDVQAENRFRLDLFKAQQQQRQ